MISDPSESAVPGLPLTATAEPCRMRVIWSPGLAPVSHASSIDPFPSSVPATPAEPAAGPRGGRSSGGAGGQTGRERENESRGKVRPYSTRPDHRIPLSPDLPAASIQIGVQAGEQPRCTAYDRQSCPSFTPNEPTNATV